MIKIINKDIFETDCKYIVHQVNCQGVMSSGIAKEIKRRYPRVCKWYNSIVKGYERNNKREELLGQVQIVTAYEPWEVKCPEDSSLCIVNMFAQYDYRYGECFTDYEAFRRCLKAIKEKCSDGKIAIPYNIGCGRGGGDWRVILPMIIDELSDCDVEIYKI